MDIRPRVAVKRVALLSLSLMMLVGLCRDIRADGDQLTTQKVDRLVGLARVWAQVRFFHPGFWQREVDLDGALLKAIPEVESATDAKQYVAAVEKMLAVLGDPSTRAEVASGDGTPREADGKDWLKTTADGVVVFAAQTPAPNQDYPSIERYLDRAKAALATAKVAVIDVRGYRPRAVLEETFNGLSGTLPATGGWPELRSVVHHGWRSEPQLFEDIYYSSWETHRAGEPTHPKAGPAHVVFVVDAAEPIPAFAIAEWQAGNATLVSAGKIDAQTAAPSVDVALPDGVVAHVRYSDLVITGTRGLAADVVVGSADDPLARAIAVATDIAAGHAAPRSSAPAPRAVEPLLRDVLDDDYPASPYPSRELRLLAGIRFWAVIEYFYPYRKLIADWDGDLRRGLVELADAKDADAYRVALKRMNAAEHDGHGKIWADQQPPLAITAVLWRRIEGKVIAAGFRNADDAKAASVHLGDELVEVDGRPVGDIVAERTPIYSGGTPESTDDGVLAVIDRGAPDSEAHVKIRNAHGKLEDVTLSRRTSYDENADAIDKSVPHYRLLDEHTGYADLNLLTPDEVDPMFDAFAKTRAVILDMRGYPNGTAMALAARINTRHAQIGAINAIPIVSVPSSLIDADVQFYDTDHSYQRIEVSSKPLYTGKVIVLIDDRAGSQSEHLCLFLEAANDVTFIGSPTHGSNGDITTMLLPGGTHARFTGLEVQHADGRQLQQVGVQPNITVRPTVRGLRAGKDEVLDRARLYVARGK